MAQPDNTLGAPTEGLGQNVTFAYNASQDGVPQLDAGGTSYIKNGIIGGNTVNPGGTQGIGVKDTPGNATLSILGAMADSAVNGALKEKRTQAYVQGMQLAMQGQAVTQIAKDQPWYSKLFGDNDVVEGARAYTGHTTAQLTAAQMTDDMPKLRAMDGPTAQRYFTDAVTNSLTGDAATDLSIQNALVQVLPGVMRQQAKEHYGWLQEQATAAEDSAFKSSAAALQAQAEGLGKQTITPEDFRQSQIQWVQNQVPADGRDHDNWQKAQTARFVNAAKQGQFHVINAANIPIGADADGNGGTTLMSTLTEEQQTKIATAVKQGEEASRQKYMATIVPHMADIKARAETMPPGQTARSLYDSMQTDNLQYRAATGASNSIWTPEEQDAVLKGAGVALFHIEDEDRKKGAALVDKQARTIAMTDAIVNGLAKGNLYEVNATPDYSKDLIDFTVQKQLRTMPMPDQNQALVNNRGYVITPVQKERDAQVLAAVSNAAAGKDAQFTDAASAIYDQWHDLYQRGPDVAAQYYPESGPRMLAFQHALDAGMPKTLAFQQSFAQPLKTQTVDKAVKEAAIAAVQSSENSINPFHPNLTPDALHFLSTKIDASAAAWTGATNDPKAGATTAFQALKGSGKVEIVGSYAWDANSDPAKQFLPQLTKSYGGQALKLPGGQKAMPYDTVGETFNRAMDAFISGMRVVTDKGTIEKTPGIATGHTPSHVLTIPTTDSQGRPALAVSIQADDGHMYNGLMSTDDVFKLAAAYKHSNENAGGAPGAKAITGNFTTPEATTAERLKHQPNIVGYHPNPN
jgi:hypothetical protein